MKQFYLKFKNDKELIVSRDTKLFKQYEEICLKIWGACPYDMSWAMQTDIFKKNSSRIYLNPKNGIYEYI